VREREEGREGEVMNLYHCLKDDLGDTNLSVFYGQRGREKEREMEHKEIER
jgi:hypothetical protein